jgi:hypothetical protein
MDWLIRKADAATRENEPGRPSALLLRHGTMTLRWYAPTGPDRQKPHAQDEIYVVASGQGSFALGRDEPGTRAVRGRGCDLRPRRLDPPFRGLFRRLRDLGGVLGPRGRRGTRYLTPPFISPQPAGIIVPCTSSAATR